jgi:Zn-dependent membrane protease YugP
MFGLILMDYWWITIPGLLLGLWAQIKLSSIYGKYSRIATSNGMTGAQAARAILDQAGLQNMPVGEVGGHLTDHYDPLKKALFLSSENYHGYSIAAVGVAAHEAGHALQHKAAYTPLKLRMTLVPVTQFASYAYMGIFLLGIISGAFAKFIGIIIGIFTVLTLFQLITLPVEFDASRRAKQQLLGMGLVARQEADGVNKVLNAAALTYVAALVTSALELLQWIMIARNRD